MTLIPMGRAFVVIGALLTAAMTFIVPPSLQPVSRPVLWAWWKE